VHGALRTGVGQANHFYAGDHFHNAFGYFDFIFLGSGKADTVVYGFFYPAVDEGIGVTENDGPKTEPVINVSTAVKILDILILGFSHYRRIIIAAVAKIRIDPVGDDFLGAFKKSVGFLALIRHRVSP